MDFWMLHSVPRIIRAGTLAVFLGIGAVEPVAAETLKEALTAAYLFNPTLKAAQAELRAIDNGVPLAKSGYRPTVSATFSGAYANAGGSYASSLNAQQNLFNGFQTYNNVKYAEANVEAGREVLRAAELNILLQAVTAYMNTYRDQAIVTVRQTYIRLLEEQLQATKELANGHAATTTDVEQAKAAIYQSKVDLSIAQGTVNGDKALFAQYIGHPPGNLRDPGPATKLLPKSLQDAIRIAETENPAITGLIFQERAQQHLVKQIKGQLLPSLSLTVGHTSANDGSSDTQVAGTLSVPVYEGGAVSAQAREAIEALSQIRNEIDAQREAARMSVSSAWGLLLAAKANIAAAEKGVETAQAALRDVRDEQMLGQRTIFDVLNAMKTLLTTQINLVSFRHDLVVASYSVLASMGRLSVSDLALQAELYDPSRYYEEVKDAWFGWGASLESKSDPRVADGTSPTINAP